MSTRQVYSSSRFPRAHALWSASTRRATKDAKYQAGFVVKCMRKSGGVQVYFVLWFDGACKPAFPLIEKEVPHVSCVVDAAHSMDLVGKDICSTKPYVAPPGRRRMKVGGGPGVRSLRGEASTQCF